MERILVLTSETNRESVFSCVESAFARATHQERVSFGLLLKENPSEDDLNRLHMLGSVRYAIGTGSLWHSVSVLWQGEDHILIAHEALEFAPGWDDLLFDMLHLLRKEVTGNPFLTGLPPVLGGSVDAFRPLGVRSFTPDHILHFMPGTPVRCTNEPQRTAFLCADFCFAPSVFFRKLESETDLLSVAAYKLGWTAYVPCYTVARSQRDLTPAPVKVPSVDSEPWQTFADRTGLLSTSDTLSGKLRTGILSPDLTWPVKTSMLRSLQDTLHSIPAGNSPLSLLRVSSFLSLSEHPENSKDENAVFLRRAAALKNFPLFLFADRETIPSVQLRHPNVMEYLDSYGLPMFRPLMDDEDLSLLRLSHVFMLQKAKERNPGHSHYVWTDPAAVYYPVDSGTMPDLKAWCGNRITMGTLNGTPDPSVIIVPQQWISFLCNELSALCESACKKHIPLPEEKEVWDKLISLYPDKFSLIPIPEPYGLMAMMLRVDQQA